MNVGDVVTLKTSGPTWTAKDWSPNMVIEGVDSAGMSARCVWFDAEMKLQRDTFSTASLKVVSVTP